MKSILDWFDLGDRVALVTGGSRGLGRVMAEALARAGAQVALSSRERGSAEQVADEIAELTGSVCFGVAMDQRDASSVERAVSETVDRLGGIDILVNNAGVNRRAPIEQLSEEDWDEVVVTNLKGPWLCSRAVVPILKERGGGRIVNVSSMLGEVGLAERTPYCSSKGGLTQMTRTLALELAPWGITVNALCPGPFATEINQPLLDDPAKRAAMEAKIPLGRWGQPEELGPALLFLASEASRFMTGSTLVIDGGYLAQ